jgi:HEXXH motif-containing protein
MAKGIFMEIPDFHRLSSFYKQHGLMPVSKHKCDVINAIEQLRKAFDFLCYENTCRENIESLVKCIQILKQPEPEFDISYSHPEVPFTIFVSIGCERSKNDVIRLAESILHETMHLKLTIIEHFCPLINDNKHHFFSPWRDEERPVQGVLHGMFVFKTILDFYESVLSSVQDVEQHDFIDWRIETIKSELKTLKYFSSNEGLNANGAILARNLLPSN